MAHRVAFLRSLTLCGTGNFNARINLQTVRKFRSYLDEPTDDPEIGKAVNLLKSRGIDANNPMLDQNAFKLFNLEPKFLVNTNELRREMRNLQRLVHPDRFVQKDSRTKRTSERLSSIINEAHYILARPYTRAKYLLGLKTGKSPNEIENSLDRLEMDPEFLSRMLELQEKLGSMFDQREMILIRDDLQREQDKLMAAVNEDFETKNHNNILEKIGRLKFVSNCYQIAEERLSKQGDTF